MGIEVRSTTAQRLSALGLAGVLAAGVAACGTPRSNNRVSVRGHAAPGTRSSSGPAAGSAKLGSATVAGVGTVLVDSQGRTLYIFVPDKHSKVTCSASCQSTWPPDVSPASGMAKATDAVKQTLIGADPNPLGGRVVTYNGWPLYTYQGDGGPGLASGQGLDLNGGLWYVIRPNGQIFRGK